MPLTEFAKRVFVAALVIAAVVLVGYTLQLFLLVFAGILLSILPATAGTWAGRKLGIPVQRATLCAVLALALLVGTMAWEFGASFAGQTDQLIQRTSEALVSLEEKASRFPEFGRILSSSSGLDLQEPAEAAASGVISAAAAMALVLFVGAYVALAPRLYIDSFLKLFSESRRRDIHVALQETADALRWWLLGQLISMALVGVITATGLLLLHVPMALPLALLATLATFVPYVGAIASAIPAMLIGFTVDNQTALYVGLVFAVAHLAEGYIAEPLIQRRFLYLPPAIVLSTQFLMHLLLGFVGIAFATPFLVVCMVMLKRFYFYENWREQKVC